MTAGSRPFDWKKGRPFRRPSGRVECWLKVVVSCALKWAGWMKSESHDFQVEKLLDDPRYIATVTRLRSLGLLHPDDEDYRDAYNLVTELRGALQVGNNLRLKLGHRLIMAHPDPG